MRKLPSTDECRIGRTDYSISIYTPPKVRPGKIIEHFMNYLGESGYTNFYLMQHYLMSVRDKSRIDEYSGLDLKVFDITIRRNIDPTLRVGREGSPFTGELDFTGRLDLPKYKPHEITITAETQDAKVILGEYYEKLWQ